MNLINDSLYVWTSKIFAPKETSFNSIYHKHLKCLESTYCSVDSDYISLWCAPKIVLLFTKNCLKLEWFVWIWELGLQMVLFHFFFFFNIWQFRWYHTKTFPAFHLLFVFCFSAPTAWLEQDVGFPSYCIPVCQCLLIFLNSWGNSLWTIVL